MTFSQTWSPCCKTRGTLHIANHFSEDNQQQINATYFGIIGPFWKYPSVAQWREKWSHCVDVHRSINQLASCRAALCAKKELVWHLLTAHLALDYSNYCCSQWIHNCDQWRHNIVCDRTKNKCNFQLGPGMATCCCWLTHWNDTCPQFCHPQLLGGWLHGHTILPQMIRVQVDPQHSVLDVSS